MQIIIPMSGFGERFRRAGYSIPKPLIEVEGRPIIEHVIDLFPSAERFVFICNEVHLANPEYRMREILLTKCPDAIIVGIAPHKLGPVYAVLAARDVIDLNLETIVNYCDFTCYWDFDDFRNFVNDCRCDGAIPSYKGFHPHSLGSTFYAYLQETGLWATNIQEKQPFTGHPIEEYASSGTYYFRSGELCLDTFARQLERDDLKINGEYYASLAYKILFEEDKKIAVYPLQHFMQWGTPEDVREYEHWSQIFHRLRSAPLAGVDQKGAVLIPMAGAGERFVKAGYEEPKPLLKVSGKPMVVQATNDLPVPEVRRFVLRRDLPRLEEIETGLCTFFPNAEKRYLQSLSEGQAITCLEGAEALNDSSPVTIGACDNGVLFDQRKFENMMNDDGIDGFVWTTRHHPSAAKRPEMFGWVKENSEGAIESVSVKTPLNDPENDPVIIGTFTFKRLGDFVRATNRMVERNQRVNGEFYVDSMIEDALAIGLNIVNFEVDAYIGWGTPEELQTFKYWQSCFHKWSAHPYLLVDDARVELSETAILEEQYSASQPNRPIDWAQVH